MWRWVLCAALVGWLPDAATADVYSYEQENGTLAFTDDPERVPAKYRSKASQSPDLPLEDYSQLTIRVGPDPRTSTPPAPVDVAAAPNRNPVAMPVVPVAPTPATPDEAAPRSADPSAYWQAAPGLLLPIGGGPDAEPIHVEREFRWIDGRYTPVLIVRRGDEELVVTEALADY